MPGLAFQGRGHGVKKYSEVPFVAVRPENLRFGGALYQ
jgi:hypothetical protein